MAGKAAADGTRFVLPRHRMESSGAGVLSSSVPPAGAGSRGGCGAGEFIVAQPPVLVALNPRAGAGGRGGCGAGDFIIAERRELVGLIPQAVVLDAAGQVSRLSDAGSL